ncbi:hypothetical protein GQ42DRAFT_152340 [Ramicandelaber brevisporus]|nr:hypothetical protein GQ42DRAFT_152340 [Ramicandelaber brevisporus]
MIRKSKAKLPGGDFSDGDEYEDLHTGEIPSDPAAFHDYGKPWSTLNHEKRTAWRKANPPTTGLCGLPMDLGIFNPVMTIRDRRHLKKINKACAKEAREILSQLPTDMNIFKEGIAPEQWSNIRSTCTGGLTHTKKHTLRDKQELAEAVGIDGLSCNTLLFRSLPWPAETVDRKFKHRRGRFIRRHLDVNGRISSDTMRRWHKMVKQQNARDKRERQLRQQVFIKQTVVPTDPVVFHDGGKIWTMPDHSQRLALKKALFLI